MFRNGPARFVPAGAALTMPHVSGQRVISFSRPPSCHIEGWSEDARTSNRSAIFRRTASFFDTVTTHGIARSTPFCSVSTSMACSSGLLQSACMQAALSHTTIRLVGISTGTNAGAKSPDGGSRSGPKRPLPNGLMTGTGFASAARGRNGFGSLFSPAGCASIPRGIKKRRPAAVLQLRFRV